MLKKSCFYLTLVLIIFNLNNLYSEEKGGCTELFSELQSELGRKALSGDINAQVALGNMYYFDKKNYEEAAYWYRRAAEPIDINYIINILTDMYYKSELINKIINKGLSYAKAVERSSHAQYMLGTMYEKGEGVTKNNKEATKWYKKAAKVNMLAQHNLGDMYHKGKGVTQNDEEAAYWYRRAADMGFSEAQFKLGNMYAKEKMYGKARYWYKKASNQGHKDASNQYLEILQL